MFGLKREKALVGLDIGSHAVKAVELRVRKKGKADFFEVARIGYEPLPHNAIVEGTIIDPAAVSETIRRLFDKSKIVNKDVVISISGNSVIIKRISLPAMEKEELAESIVWEAKHNIPYPYEETHVDYAILRPAAGADGQNLEILLVAAKKDKIESYSGVVEQARKNLEAVEVDAFALTNALEVNYPDDFRDKITALLNIGATVTTIVICERGVPQLFRDLSLGGSYFIENIRKDFNVGHGDAEDMLRGVPSKAVPAYDLEALLGVNVKSLLEEVEKTFTFFKAEDKAQKKIEQIFLCGGLANLKNIAGAFEQKFGVKTILFDPFRTVFYNEKKLNPAYYQEMATLFGVATGLATRQRGT
jgi:type IV pilus assembly protein PilM